MKGITDNPCSLEDILTNLYRLENVRQINYQQYVPNKTDNQWSIQAELFLRRKNPKVLAALFSRELWCFSINDEPLPELDLELSPDSDSSQPEKKGHFTPEFSKPNLPTPYAIFMKALRRMIYVNLTLTGKDTIVPFGNSCIYQRPKSNMTKILHFDPHLFENGDLTVAICSKNLNISKLCEESLTPDSALYLAPSGIRVYLPSNELSKCYVPAPKNATMFLKTLLVSHGIDLLNKIDLKWVKLMPNANHLNGFTPTISHYLDKPKSSNYVIWPTCLCFVQQASDSVSSKENTDDIFPMYELDDCFDMIDGFIQLKITSAYRTPGTAANIGTLTGHNPLSTGGVFTDQFQGYNRNTGNSNNNTLSTGDHGKYSPEFSPDPSVTPNRGMKQPRSTFPNENYSGGFITTPNINENITPTVDDLIADPPSIKPQNDLWGDRKDSISAVSSQVPKEMSSNSFDQKTGSEEGMKSQENIAVDIVEESATGNVDEDADFNKDLFGEDSEDESFNSNTDDHLAVKEITDEMFDIAEDEDEVEETTNTVNTTTEQDSSSASPETMNKKTSTKRTYLDIPVDVITIENTPTLYEDPGAPLPIETPKDKKKSIYAPLNFNPMFESNVDNKYKNGGKFSFNPDANDEPLQFGVSTDNISSSEDEDSDFSPNGFNNNNTSSLQKLASMENRVNDIPMLEASSYEQVPNDTLPELLNPPASKDDSTIPSFNMMGGLIDKPMKVNQLDSIWKMGSTSNKVSTSQFMNKQNTDSSNLEDNSLPNSNPPLYFDSTPALGTESLYGNFKRSDSPENILVTQTDRKDETNKNSDEKQQEEQEQPESSRILPYLLRHMPLFSIPDRFLAKNPSLPPGHDLDEILDILSEQIIFNTSMFSNLQTSSNHFQGIKDCSEGAVEETMSDLFSEFTKLRGNEIIEEFFYLPEPSVYVKKSESTIKVKSSSSYFSEYLNLKPNRGVKNFRALFLTTEAKNDCLNFVSQMSQTYSNQELGFCELTKLTNDDTKGLIYLKNFNQDTLLLLSAQIVSFCSTTISNVSNVPLLIFLPLKEPSLNEYVSMILKFHLIKKEVKSKLPKAEVLLRLIDIDFIKNPLTSISAYNPLCVSIYNCLPPKTTKFTTLANDLPRKVEFRAMNDSSSLSIHYDNYIHLAYLRSIDREWLSAAWSDTKGIDSFVKTWYVGNSRTRFEQVCNEIWRITLQIASTKFGKVCLVLTRLDSVLPDDELIHWRRLSVATKDLHLAVVCVGENTKLSLFDEGKIYPTFKRLFKDENNSVPISGDHIDDYEIVNTDEEVHGLLFSNPLQLANSQHRCAIKSGALVRFNKGEGNQFMDKFEVNLLNCPHSDSATLLKSILEQYRNLAGLNSWFGISSGKDNYIPWHVVAVRNVMDSIIHVKSSFEKETYIID